MTSALGLDLGASGIRAISHEMDHSVSVTDAAPESDRHNQAVRLAGEVQQKLDKKNFDQVCLGLSGFSSLNVDKEELAKAVGRLFSAKQIIVTSDMVTPHYAYFEERDGVVAAVGTGTLFFGISGAKQARIDGLGATIGDFGSAYWIGREALRRSARGFELGKSSWLIESLQQELGNYRNWPKKVADGNLRTFEIAGLSRVVAEGVINNDQLSTEIATEAAEYVSNSVIALCKRLDVDQVALSGGVLSSEFIRELVVDALSEVGLKPTISESASVEGSLKIAQRLTSPRIDFLHSQQQLIRLDV